MAQHASYMAGIEYSPADMVQREDDWVNPGVLTSSDLVVSISSNLTVNVAGASQGSDGGNAWLPGGYRFYNDAVKSITLATANTTNPRIDLIVACVDTSQNPYVATIKAITGTPAASPAVPSVPGTLVYIPLAQVYVGANATTISAGNITDVRTIAGLQGDASHLTNLNSQPEFASHLEDDVNHVPYAVATGVANTYAVTLNPAPTTYVDGMAVCVKINVASTGASTLNVNGLGAKSIKDSLGNAITSGGLKANTPYTLRYESTSGSFIVQGKGGGGNATADKILSPYTATVDSGQITGTIASKSLQTYTPTTTAQTIALGQYLSGTQTIAGDAKLIASNIVGGVSIFNVAGTASIASLGGLQVATGTTSSLPMTIVNGNDRYLTVSLALGFTPKIFVFYPLTGATYLTRKITFIDYEGFGINVNGATMSIWYDEGISSTTGHSYSVVADPYNMYFPPTATEAKVPYSDQYDPATSCAWLAIG